MGKVVGLTIPDIGTILLTDRFRLPGGTVTHLARVIEDERGFYVFVLCRSDTYEWYHSDEDERLGLIQPDDADVTCVKCREIEDRTLAPHTPE